ncbi:MAG: hypothetical protein IJN28_06060 [Selenomonadales bacterium]|nr:hypothetical protein [Selenomonadales bacterium]
MNMVMAKVFGVLFAGAAAKMFIVNGLAWVVIDLVVLGVAYLILKQHPYIDLKKAMSYLGAITFISVLVDLGIIGGEIGNMAVLALLLWMMFGDRLLLFGDRYRVGGPRDPRNKALLQQQQKQQQRGRKRR